MELIDYLNGFLQGTSRTNLEFTERLEKEGQEVTKLITLRGDTPSALDLDRVTRFLVEVEKWKADCREEQTGKALRNGPEEIWLALSCAVKADNDKTALLSIMGLTGFGVSRDARTGQRRAKRATAVLRFLDPDNWGVVDWRVVVVLGLYMRSGLDIDAALQEAKKHSIGEVAGVYDLINEDEAMDIVRHYRDWRTPKLPRAVDVELALYGASFTVWPRPR